MKLKIASCQFPVTADIKKNYKYIVRQIKQAASKKADIIHFPESALSGYAGVNFNTFKNYNWDLLKHKTNKIMDMASRCNIWVLLGSTHKLSQNHKPHNSVYVINSKGKIVTRYDKMFCCGDKSGKKADLKYYSPGNYFCTFNIIGIKCGILICHDFRYEELYRQYYKKKTKVIFHSFHNAGCNEKDLIKYYRSGWRSIVPATMQAYAANNFMWISATNSSLRLSCWPTFFVEPDGVISGKLKSNIPGILINTVNINNKFFDSSKDWRDRAINGIYHSGRVVKDKRSDCRTEL